jgi:hypothetical protein
VAKGEGDEKGAGVARRGLGRLGRWEERRGWMTRWVAKSTSIVGAQTNIES